MRVLGWVCTPSHPPFHRIQFPSLLARYLLTTLLATLLTTLHTTLLLHYLLTSFVRAAGKHASKAAVSGFRAGAAIVSVGGKERASAAGATPCVACLLYHHLSHRLALASTWPRSWLRTQAIVLPCPRPRPRPRPRPWPGPRALVCPRHQHQYRHRHRRRLLVSSPAPNPTSGLSHDFYQGPEPLRFDHDHSPPFVPSHA